MPRRLPPRSLKRQTRAVPPKPYIPSNTEKPAPVGRPKLFASSSEEDSSSHLKQLYQRLQQNIENDSAHFRIGEKEVYFPHAKIVLLRPNPKHTPFQAKFLVPRNFNKLDLRDYLWNIYGLRALNVTTQLLWAKWDRQHPRAPRFRQPQVKKMTIDMVDPFVWPEPTTENDMALKFRTEFHRELEKYAEDMNRIGSDKLRPPTSFGGLVGPYVEPPSPFIPKRLGRQMRNKKADAEKKNILKTKEESVKNFLGLA